MTIAAEREKTAERWSSAFREGNSELAMNWLCNSQVLSEYVYPQFGSDFYAWFQRGWCQVPRERMASVCAGLCWAEREFLKRGAVQHVDAWDLAPEIVASVERAAGLTVMVGDANVTSLQRNRYDVAMGWMALHHVEGLEFVLEEMAGCLRPGWVLLVNEYVGPSRFAFSDEAWEYMDGYLKMLPASLRRDANGEVRLTCRFDPEAVRAQDPSEAVRSGEILDLVRRRFMVRARVDYGGGLLFAVLAGSMRDYDPGNQEHCRALRALYEAEREGMRSGILPVSFTCLVAEPRR